MRKQSVLFYFLMAAMAGIIFIRCNDKKGGAASLPPQPTDTTRTLIVYWEKSGNDSAKFLSESQRITFDVVDMSKEPLVRSRDTNYFVPKSFPDKDSTGVQKKDSLGNPIFISGWFKVEKKSVTWELGTDLDSLLTK